MIRRSLFRWLAQILGGLLAFAVAGPVAFAQGVSEKPILVLDTGGHTDGIPGLVFSPQGKHLFSASRDKTIRMWDVETGAMLRVFRLPIGSGRAGILSS